MKAVLYFAPLFSRFKRPLLTTLLLSLITLAAGIALLGVSGWFLTAAALSTAGAAFNLFAPSAGVRGLSFLRILSRYGEKLSGHDATLKLLSDLRAWLFARLFPLVPLDRLLGRSDLISRLLGDVDALDTMFLVALGPISTAVITSLAGTVLLAFLLPAAAPIYGLASLSAALLVPLGLIALSRPAGRAAIEASSALRQGVLDSLDGHQDLILFGATAPAQAGMSQAARSLGAARRRLGGLGALASACVQILAGVTLVGTLLVGLTALEAGQISGPLLAGILLGVIASFEASAMLVRSATRLAGAVAAAERLQALAQAPRPVLATQAPRELPAGGAIAFEHVRFGHDPARPVLHDLSFSIANGECVAITGPSGAGKSTIAQLMARLCEPQAGRVTINGLDLRDCDPAQVQSRLALMLQDAPVFLDSIRDNLKIGNAAAPDTDLWRVLEQVGLAGFVTSLPGGLDTLLGEAGRTLSAGQARRLCLARMLLSQARIIVLDEPTSGLDSEAEASFLADLPAIAAGRTMIVITHAAVPAGFGRVLTLRAGQLWEI
jgi:ATP-binding cassette, subfamily C, bacterial CydC